MSEADASHPDSNGRLAQALLIGVGLALVVMLVACPASALAVHQRMLPPPAFAARFGGVEIIAPCPRGIFCDASTPFYAIYWGVDQPDGSTRYHQLFFVYLKPGRRSR